MEDVVENPDSAKGEVAGQPSVLLRSHVPSKAEAEADAREEKVLEEWSQQNWGIPGVVEALTEALTPVAHLDKDWGLEEMVKKVEGYFRKTSRKFEQDDRAKERGSAVEAQTLVEEYVFASMTMLAAACYDKAWLPEVDFSVALIAAAKYTFRSGKLFCRTLGPFLKKYVDEGLFRYREEDRIQKVMTDGLKLSGLSDSSVKQAYKALDFSYNEAHMSASYGSSSASTPEIGLLQDFVKYWMMEFCVRAWEVLEHGIPGGKQEHFAFVTNLFNHMCDPCRSILPADIISELGAPPREHWPFIADQAMATLEEIEQNPPKRRRTGGRAWKTGSW